MALIYKENSGSKVAGPDLRYVRLGEALLHVGPPDYRIEPYSALRKTGKGVFKQVWKIAVNLEQRIITVQSSESHMGHWARAWLAPFLPMS